MRCVLVDDEPKAIEILKRYVHRVPFLEFAGAFRDPLKALAFLAEGAVDLVFLDINMPDLTGMQFLNALHERPLVIFTTAYSEHAVRSYDYDAVDYLLKPIEFERFLRAANKAQEKYLQKTASEHGRKPEGRFARKEAESCIMVKSGTDYYHLELAEILYLEAAGNYVFFVTRKSKIMSLMSLKEACNQLPTDRFFRIHKSFIVNLGQVSKIERDFVNCGDREIPIGDSYRESFLKALGLH